MARQISGGLLFPAAAAIAAHNETHRAVVALETAKPHYDGPEFDSAGIEQVLTQFYPSTITTLADAINCVEKAIALWDAQHTNRHNGGSGLKIYAHKVAGTTIGGTVGPAGAVLEAAMIAAWGPLVIAAMQALQDHMLNVGGTWHATADSFNVIVVPSSITTKTELQAACVQLRAVYEAHRARSAGGVPHSSADSTNTISAEPPDTADDWDKVKALLTEIATDLPAHAADSGIHNAAQSITLSSASYPTAVSTAFTRANAYKSTHNSDLGSTTIHHSADSSYTLSSSDASTVATYVTLSEEIRTDQTGHFRNAPTSTAERGI